MAEARRTRVTIANKLGLHARPAMQFVDTASQFRARITVRKQDHSVDGKSIMEMLTLAAGFGTELELEAVGEDAEAALNSLSMLLSQNFDGE